MPARSRPHSDPAGLGPGLSFLQVAESKVPKPACSTTSPSWPQAKCAPSSTTPARCSPPNAATPDFLALHDELTAARIRPIIPVVVLAQAWRGGPQHQISRVLKAAAYSRTTSAPAAPPASAAPTRVPRTSWIPSSSPPPSATRLRVVTGDPGDLTRIADSTGVKIRIFAT
jgi:hypothetical protein